MPTFEDLLQGSLNPAVPESEKIDINGELLRGWIAGMAEGRDPGYLDELHEAAWSDLHNPGLMAKAMRLEQYADYANPVEVSRDSHTSILHLNEMGLVGGLGPNSQWVERPGTGFEFLRTVVEGTDVIKAILLTRQRQVSAFAVPESDPSPTGWRFVRRDRKKIAKGEQKKLLALEDFVLNCGDESDPRERKRLDRVSFQQWMKTFIWQTLSADAAPLETVLTAKGELSGWYNVPYSTVRLCSESGYEGDDRVIGVQLINAVPHVAYTLDDLVYEVRNPRADLDVNGYGYSETEMIVRLCTAYINTVAFNMAGMDRNSLPRGVGIVYGDFESRAQQEFKSMMKAMATGAGNRFNVPWLFSKGKDTGGIDWKKLDEVEEMMFARWLTFLMSISCAVFGIDPNEINFNSFAVQKSSLSGNDTEEKLAHSRDKGLIPTVRFPFDVFNEHVLRLKTDEYKVEPVGLYPEDEKAKQERLKLSSTIDELRDVDGRDPMEDEDLGKAPSNASLMQVHMGKLQLRQQQEAQGGAGPFGVDGKEDYPMDDRGQHSPYGKDEAGDDDVHTFDANDDQDLDSGFKKPGRAEPMAKAILPGIGRLKQKSRGLIVIERGVDRDTEPLEVKVR